MATRADPRASGVVRALNQMLIAGHFLAFASGATALIYEVLWMRRFVTLFGATAPAASATLSAIFIGLGFGSAFIGLQSARFARPLRAYGILEIGVGLGAALVEPVIGMYGRVFPALYSAFAGHHSTFVAVKTVLAVVALFLPAFLMGGTIALLAQAFVTSPQRTGITGAGLYAANTLGATVGALSVPFWLLPALGVKWSYFSTVFASLSIGAVAWWLDACLPGIGSKPFDPHEPPITTSQHAKAYRSKSSPAVTGAKADITGRATSMMPRGSLAAMAFLSGALTLGLEILWMRMLAQVHENSIYSFAIVLAVFLVGLAAGAFLARRLVMQGRDARRTLGLAWIGAGLLVFASPGLFYALTQGLSYASEFGSPEFVTLGFAAATMLIPTILAGMILPLVLQLTTLAKTGAPGAVLGKLLAQNTAGAVIGPLVVTYLLFPGPGLWLSIAAAGIVMALVGDAVLMNLQTGRPATIRRAVIVAFIVVVTLIVNPFTLPRAKIDRGGKEILAHLEEGAHGIVAVLENPSARWMLLNNFYTLGGTASAIEERQQAQIPLFIHPAPRRVAFLGLGTGITAGGGALPSVQKIVAIEMVPEVINTAERYFGEANLSVLKDPRVEVVHEDARIYLKAGREKFDVIIGDLVVPWRSGESSLFTHEHFETVRRALAPGGLFCQWLPMFQLSEEQFKIVAATFLDVFPQTTIWRGDLLPKIPAVALIGHTDPTCLDADAVDRRIRQLKPSCVQTSPIVSELGGLWLFLIGPIRPTDPAFAQARRNREGEPWVELLSPLTHLRAEGPRVFTGERLYRFMEQTRAAPLEGTVLANLGTDHLRWRRAGSILWHASMLLHQGREDEANRRAAESFAMIPAELRKAINGE